jgi:Flp pilus assembly protein TadD
MNSYIQRLPTLHGFILLLLLAGCAATPAGPSQSAAAILLAETELALNAGDLATAMAKLRRLQSVDPANRDGLRLSARLYAQIGDTAAQQEVTARILEHDPQDVQALAWLGLSALRSSQLTVAADYLQQVVAIDPFHWQALNGLGVIADAEGRPADAQIHYRQGLALIPGHPKLTANLGWSKVLSGELQEAEILLQNALKTAPDVIATRSNLAFCVALQGRYDQAMQMYTTLYGEATALNNVGYAAMLRGDDKVAETYLQQAISSRPSFYAKAAKNLARVGSSSLQRDYDSTLE